MNKIIRNIDYYISIIAFLFFVSCGNNSGNKIKLSQINSESETQTIASEILKISPENEKKIVIAYFSNKTSDVSLNWLERGLSGMLESDLSQSPYLTIIPVNKIPEAKESENKNDSLYFDIKNVLKAAKSVQADLILSGSFYNNNDSLYIHVEMYNPQYEKPVNSATVSGENLESIFSMVNQLSQDLYAQLRNKETSDIEKGKPTTNSVEAFRYYVAGMTALENYRFVDAEDELLKAVKEDNTYALAFFKLSNIQYIIGKNQEAYKNFQNAGKYYDKLSETDKISYDIRRLNMEGHYAKMVDALREAINKYPSNIDFHLHYARILRGSGFLDNALEEFEYVLELDPGIKTVYNDLGYLYAARGDFSSAIKYINHYMKLQPDEANPYDSKGEILRMAGRLDEAIKAFQTALIKWPQFTHSALSLADIYREKGDERQSLAYIKAAENSVNGLSFLWDIQNAKFHTYWRFGRLDKARKVLYDIRKLDQFRASPLFLAEFFYNSIGDETEAENICKSTFQQYSDIINNNKENFHHTKTL